MGVVDEAGGAAEEEKRRLSSCLALHVSQPDREPSLDVSRAKNLGQG